MESAPIVPIAVSQELGAEAKAKTPRHRALSGSAVLLGGLSMATLFNFVYNIAVAKYLGAAAFGHTTAVYTLLILISSVTLSFQILTAKIVAQQRSPERQTLAYREFHWRAWTAGIFVSLLLLLFRNSVSTYLNLHDSTLIVLLAIGATFYVPLGARRGYLQGVCNFRHLALNLMFEGFCRLSGSVLLIQLGRGVRGVIAANAAAVVVAYLSARSQLRGPDELTTAVPVAFREGLQAAVFFAGQVVINNCDIIVVKHLFPAVEAGLYAAVAMVGRVVFVFSWAVVSSMFPIAAETRSRRQEDRGVLGSSMLIVAGISLAFLLGLRLASGEIWPLLFGAHFASAGGENFRYLLVLYAANAGVYCLSVVLIAYEMSHKIANTGWVQLVISGAVIAGIYRFHSSLAQVIWVQVVMMAVLLVSVAIPFLVPRIIGDSAGEGPPVAGFVRRRRRVPENEVIAEFLKNDLHSSRFAHYAEVPTNLVVSPDLEDDNQNSIRRALFNVRHGSLWRELPQDTEWFEAEIGWDDLDRIRVFPRAQWRKLAWGDFGLRHVAERIVDDRYRNRAKGAFLEKIENLRDQLENGHESVAGIVLLIGQSETGPFTILDGNHRLVAAMLTSRETFNRFRFFCGLSPKMTQCCWYKTNLATLGRYATNMVRHFARGPEKELIRVLQRCETDKIMAVGQRATGPNKAAHSALGGRGWRDNDTRPLATLARKLRGSEYFARILRRGFRTLQRVGINVTPCHFYWPIPDIAELENRCWPKCAFSIPFDLRLEQQVDFLRVMAGRYGREWSFADQPANGSEYHYNNGFFESVDAEIAYSFVRHYKPARIIEIGAGYSTRALAAALQSNLRESGVRGELISVDPHPDRLPQPNLSDMITLLPVRVQELDLEFFGSLEKNDILFIDSSHIVGIGSDVVREYLEILPRVQSGVLIHVHDIFLPSDYPRESVLNHLSFWSEQYLLQAFLSFNPNFKVLWASSAMQTFHADDLAAAFPRWPTSYRDMPKKVRQFLPTPDHERVWPSSFWMTRL